LVHYILDGLTLCGDLRAQSWTANPDLASCAGCRILLSHVGAYDERAAALLEARPPRATPVARLRLR
jgi:hypothetical protein